MCVYQEIGEHEVFDILYVVRQRGKVYLEVWFCSSLGVPIPALIGPPQQCACNTFRLP